MCVRGFYKFLLQGLIIIITQLSLSVIIHQHKIEQNINKTDRLHILLLCVCMCVHVCVYVFFTFFKFFFTRFRNNY